MFAFDYRFLWNLTQGEKTEFFSEQPFYGNHPTLDSHTNTEIPHVVAYSSTVTGSKHRNKKGYVVVTFELLGYL